MISDRDHGDAADAAATLLRFVLLDRRDEPGEDEKGMDLAVSDAAILMGLPA